MKKADLSEFEIREFGSLVPGDVILSPEGFEVPVRAVNQIHTFDTTYKMTTINKDGSKNEIVLSGNHLIYVISDVDYSQHASRKRRSRAVLSKLSPQAVKALREIAIDEENVEYETSLADMITLLIDDNDNLSTSNKREILAVIARCAESVGHTSENKGIVVNEDGTYWQGMNVVRFYPALPLARQLLSLHDKKSPYKTLVGRVITVQDAVELMQSGVSLTIPELETEDER